MIKSVMGSLLLAAAGIAAICAWAGTTSAASFASANMAQQEQGGGYLAPQPEEHGDGVGANCRLQMTPVLYDAAKGREVRYVSYCVTFESSYAASSLQSAPSVLIGCITALVDVDPDSVTAIKSSLGGLDPGLGLSAAEPSPPAHTYEVLIHPPEGQPWRTTDASDVVVDIIRME